MNILVLNAGSSSLKFKLFRIRSPVPLDEPEETLAEGKLDRIGTADAQLTFFSGAGDAAEPEPLLARSVADAAQEIIRRISRLPAAAKGEQRIDATGHRIVHGGDRFHEPVVIDPAVLTDLHELVELAPLHNPAGIAGIEATTEALHGVPNVAVFDTAFHHAMPAVAATYALPLGVSNRFRLRRYGFHGISYRFISERLQQGLKPPVSAVRVVVCHLGNGASVCAMRDGRSVDTSMGFTPMEGLVMGNRSGDVDPGLVLHLQRAGKMTVDEVDGLLNRESGLLGLSGRSGDVRDLERLAESGDSAARFALECFAYRARKYIGAYAAVLGGVDTVVFTGGIGEHSADMRARICDGLEFLGLHLDEGANRAASGAAPAPIGADAARVWIVPTDEERQIARETFTLLNRT